MLSIERNRIRITRGDTLRLTIQIKDQNNNDYKPEDGDTIRFACKKYYDDEMPLIIKNIPTESMELHLNPEDTKGMEQPSDYVYDIQVTLSNGDVYTVVSGIFEITEEVD